jgi:small GTP-binding protein
MTSIPVLKVVIAGDGTVGKTSLVRRYCEGKFEATRIATIGVDFQTKTVELPDGVVKLSIWDMAGQDRFQFIRTDFYRGSRAAALVFDVTQPETFEHLHRWKQEILEVVPEQKFIVIGNKIDLEHTLPESLDEFVAGANARFIPTSALDGRGVPQLFEALAQAAR